MSEYRISHNMDTCDIMYSLFESEMVGFAYECYDCLSAEQQKDFIETLGADEVVDLLGENVIIEELEGRGYIITK
nr:MAG TPA: hypothetical protein [Caudoviricetes sp.]